MPFRSLALILLCFGLSACAGSGPDLFPPAGPMRTIELEDTPFFAQRSLQCGPAALAMLLGSSGRSVSPDDLTPYLYLPGRNGSLQLEMISASRRFDRLPYVIDPEPSAIQAELLAGRPVVVLQNLGVRLFPVYHYAVVVGLLAEDRVVLRSGEERRLVMAGNRFAATWRRADCWAMVLLRSGELPAGATPDRYLREVAAFESMGRFDIARAGYQAALERWPDQPVALFGLANILLAEKKYSEAVGAYRRLLQIQPQHAAAINNLAEAVSRQGCFAEAISLIDNVLEAAGGGGEFAAALRQTRLEIVSRWQDDGGRRRCVPASPVSPR